MAVGCQLMYLNELQLYCDLFHTPNGWIWPAAACRCAAPRSHCTHRESRARFGGGAISRNAQFGGRDHRIETRIITEGIEVRIDFGVLQEATGHRFEKRTEQFECGVDVRWFYERRKAAGEVIACIHVVRINQQGTADPILGAFSLAQSRP